MTIPGETLMAYADGELGPIEAARVERAIAADPALAAEVARHRALAARVAGAYAPIAEAAVPDRLSAMLASNVVPLRARAVAAPSSRRGWLTGAAIAASLVVGIVAGRGLAPAGESAPRLADGTVRALETQLASVQPADAATRIGLTFRADGRWCRSYEAAESAGIACREGDGWRLHHWSAGDRQPGTYRQADAGLAAVAAEMAADGPVDAAAERAARDGGWR